MGFLLPILCNFLFGLPTLKAPFESRSIRNLADVPMSSRQIPLADGRSKLIYRQRWKYPDQKG